MKRILFLLLLVFCFQTSNAQIKYYEREIGWTDAQSAHDIFIVSDSQMAMLCWGWSFTESDKAYTLFTDINADHPIVKGYYSQGETAPMDMIRTSFGYAFCGWTNNGMEDPFGQTYDYQYLMEINHQGDSIRYYDLREFLYQGDAMCLLYYPEINTYYIGGEAFMSTMPTSMWLMKITNGEIVWRRYYSEYAHRNAIRKLLPAPDGGVYAVGMVDLYPGFYFGNYFIAKIDTNGNIAWSKTYTVGFEDQCIDGLQTFDEGFVIAGGSNRPNPINGNKLYPTLLRLNANADTLWSRIYFLESLGGGYIAKVFEDGNNLVCIGGKRDSVGSYTKAFIMKVRGSDGEPLWTRFYDYGISHDYFYNFTPVPQPLGGFVCVGRADTLELIPPVLWSLGRAYIVKTNCMGLLTLPQAQFTISQDSNLPARFLFTNQSQYVYPDSIDGGHYIWNFGDGSPLYICGQGYEPCTQNTLTHTYQATGVYPVTLTAVVCNDTSVAVQSVCLGVEPNPQAAFTYTDFGGIIQFTNLSQNAYFEQGGYCHWDFGDGSPPVSDEHPTHTYAENGNYLVTLTLVVCADTSVYTQEVQVQTVSIQTPPFACEGGQGGELKIYPNPATNMLTFQRVSKSPLGDLGVRLLSLTGQTVLETTLAAGGASQTVSVAHLPAGVYFYTVQSGGGAVLARGKVAVVR